jgi:hypothetical protein
MKKHSCATVTPNNATETLEAMVKDLRGEKMFIGHVS